MGEQKSLGGVLEELVQAYEHRIDEIQEDLIACESNSLGHGHSEEEIPATYLGLAYFFYEQGRFDKAEEVLKKALELDPQEVEAYNNLGCIYLEQGRFDEAEQLFRKALKLNPKQVEAYNNLGCAYLGQERFDEAEQMYRKALRLDPKNGLLQKNLEDVIRKQQELKLR